MKEIKKKVWFPAKKYGIGWGLPIAWEGWAVLLTYVLLATAGTIAVSKSPENIIWFLPYILILSILLIFICWKKGEKAEWRWDNKK